MPHLPTHPAHLGPGAKAVVEPEFTGMDWYEDYSLRHAADGAEGRLVSQYDFSESWQSWEVHPHGAELSSAPPAPSSCTRNMKTAASNR